MPLLQQRGEMITKAVTHGVLQIWYPDGKGLPPAFAIGNGRVGAPGYLGEDLEELLETFDGEYVRITVELA